MGVPSEVNIESRNNRVKRVLRHDMDESGILENQSCHGLGCGWTVKPIKTMHFLNEDTLSDHCTTKLEGKDGGVFPISGHHSKTY